MNLFEAYWFSKGRVRETVEAANQSNPQKSAVARASSMGSGKLAQGMRAQHERSPNKPGDTARNRSAMLDVTDGGR